MLHCSNSIYGDGITSTLCVCKNVMQKRLEGFVSKKKNLPELKLEPSKVGIDFCHLLNLSPRLIVKKHVV